MRSALLTADVMSTVSVTLHVYVPSSLDSVGSMVRPVLVSVILSPDGMITVPSLYHDTEAAFEEVKRHVNDASLPSAITISSGGCVNTATSYYYK